MAVADDLQRWPRAHPRVVTTVLTVIGYALVIGAFAGALPIPTISEAAVNFLGHAIAVVNTLALFTIVAGVWQIRQGNVRKHRALMLTSFGLILAFLVLYLVKVGGGFDKSIVAEGAVLYAYLGMLAVHILLSILAVPVVIHAVVLGLTHSPTELRDTAHKTVGRIAVASWGLSLFLGVVTYVMLNHIYGWVPREALLLLLAVPKPDWPN